MCRVSIYRVLLRSNSAGYTDVGPGGCVCATVNVRTQGRLVAPLPTGRGGVLPAACAFSSFFFVFFGPSVVFPAGWLHDELDERRTEVAQRRAAASHQVIERSCRSRAIWLVGHYYYFSLCFNYYSFFTWLPRVSMRFSRGQNARSAEMKANIRPPCRVNLSRARAACV